MTTGKSIGRYNGKAQIVAAAREISERRALGWSKRKVHEELNAEGIITVPYSTFVRWVTRLEAGAINLPAVSAGIAGRNMQHSGGRNIRGATSDQTSTTKTDSDLQPTASPNVERRNGVVIAKMGVTNPPRKPLDHKPDLKRLIGDDYEE